MNRKIAVFCIPAHGHTNPMLPVVKELVRRGDTVRFYSFDAYEEKIRKTGAEYISCDRFLGELTEAEAAAVNNVSSTELAVQDIRITRSMAGFLREEFETFRPDVVFTDAVCFWGKLNAWKYNVPMVASTSTFAFNQMSSSYMKNSLHEMAGLILGLPRISKELKTLEPYGYHVKDPLALIQNDNDTDTVVYTSKRFQPYAESFSGHYLFAGPSVFSDRKPEKEKDRPLIYVSMGTIINDRPDLYRNCIEALKDLDIDLIISCGGSMDPAELGQLPDNVSVFPYVDQLDILNRADVFLTHSGMNSVSESLYMATPMVLYPQTNEQKAVARRTAELGAGLQMKDDSPQQIRDAVQKVLGDKQYAQAAQRCSDDFRSCPGPAAAADFIENAPHVSDGPDLIKELNRANGRFTVLYYAVMITLMILLITVFKMRHAWILGVILGCLATPIGNRTQQIRYRNILRKYGISIQE